MVKKQTYCVEFKLQAVELYVSGELGGHRPVMEMFSQYQGIFGRRKIMVWLRKTMKKTINHKRIYRLMKGLGIFKRGFVKNVCFTAKEKAVSCHKNWYLIRFTQPVKSVL